MSEKEIYRQAIDKWGQITMVFEEMAELQKELCKSLRGKENRIEIAEEMADVEIMLEQMKILFGIEEGVERHKTLKLQRLEGRLKRQEGQLWR
jgi:translation initiation factor 2 alpha subunit (eIF-2alpha)